MAFQTRWNADLSERSGRHVCVCKGQSSVIVDHSTVGSNGYPKVVYGPGMQVIKLGPQKNWILIPVHHGIADQMGTLIVQKDLAALYNAAVDGDQPELSHLPVQDSDYMAFLTKQDAAGDFDESKAYWKEQFSSSESSESSHPEQTTPPPPPPPAPHHTSTQETSDEISSLARARLHGRTPLLHVTSQHLDIKPPFSPSCIALDAAKGSQCFAHAPCLLRTLTAWPSQSRQSMVRALSDGRAHWNGQPFSSGATCVLIPSRLIMATCYSFSPLASAQWP